MGNIKISGVAPLGTAGAGDVSYITSSSYAQELKQSQASACFITPDLMDKAPPGMGLLKTFEPHLAYARALGYFYPAATYKNEESAQHATAIVDPSAKIEAGVKIEAGAVIGANVQIGAGTTIGAYAVVEKNCAIGRNCYIGAHCAITHSLIGDGVLIHTGCRLGQAGFGYVPQMNGAVRVPQVGRVIIQDHVDIGANTTIDRGSVRDTTIGEHTKIDNLVQIGHNVSIGRHCFIIAQVGIAGSAVIGDYAILLGQVGVADNARIGEGARIGAKAGIMSEVPAGADYMGYPAKNIKQWLQETALLTKLWKDRKNKRGK